MKLKLTILSSAMLLMFFNFMTFAQDNSDPRWNQSPSTKCYIGGTYSTLPSVQNYVQRDKTTHVYHTPQGDLIVPANVRPFPSATVTESEENLVSMTGNQNVMYGAWNSYATSGTFYGTGFCFTSNGGTTWSGNVQQIASGNNGDPGPWVWSSASTWPGRLGISVIGSAGISATYSTDNGATWTPFVNAGGSSTDKNLSCVDDVPGSPFLGRAYTVWTDFGGTYVNRIVGAYTSNGGVTWTGYTPVSPAPASGNHNQGCDVCVGPGGVVYACWGNCFTNGQSSTEIHLGFAKSTDGGVTWPVTTNSAVTTNGIRAASFLTTGIRVNGFPRIAVDKSGGARNGWIYCVMAEKTNTPALDNADICLMRSTDGGTTWTHTRVNQDPSGSLQWFPSVTVDIYGNVAVGYYDERGLTNPITQYYVSFSNTGGTSWTDYLVSDHTFTPVPISGLATGYQGDYTGIAYSNGKFWPFWCDNSSGIYNTWTCGLQTISLAHDIAMGPFLSFPPFLTSGSTYAIKGKATNLGTSTESSISVKWLINNVLTNTNTIPSLTSGQSDSVSNNWVVPAAPGTYNLKYISSLGTDTNRVNDTIQTNVTITHDFAMGPFLGFPGNNLIINTPYNIKARVQDVGNFNETAVPVNFYVNGTLTNTQNKTLNVGQIDSVSNTWTPTVVGVYTLKYIAALTTDGNHANDTVQATVTVYVTIPGLPLYCSCDNVTYTPITGTAGPTGDDQTVTVTIPFSFTYLGSSYTQVSVCTNGWVAMGTTASTTYVNTLCTTTSTDLKKICGFWDDLYFPAGGNLQYTTTGSAPDRVFVAQWTNAPFISSTTNYITFQIRLHETSNSIEIIYGPGSYYASASGSIGLIDSVGGVGHFKSLVPGATCASTTKDSLVCHDAIPYNSNLASGTRYIFGCPVGIKPLSNEIPSVYSLSQNYPNPFNPETRINYAIPKTGLVKIVVYDVLGAEVAILVNENKTPGNYNVIFSGTNFASGVYFYKITAGDFSAVKKMLLVK